MCSFIVLSRFFGITWIRRSAVRFTPFSLNSTTSYRIDLTMKSDRSHIFRKKTVTAVISLLILLKFYLTFINSSLPFATDTCAVFLGSGSLLTPYWYSHVIEASSSGYFAFRIVTPSASPVMFKSEK